MTENILFQQTETQALTKGPVWIGVMVDYRGRKVNHLVLIKTLWNWGQEIAVDMSHLRNAIQDLVQLQAILLQMRWVIPKQNTIATLYIRGPLQILCYYPTFKGLDSEPPIKRISYLLESINGWGYCFNDKINPNQLSILLKINTTAVSHFTVNSSTPAIASQITYCNFMTCWRCLPLGV